MLANNDFRIDGRSRAALDAVPGRLASQGSAAIWRSILVSKFERPANVEAFDLPATPDQLVVMMTRGRCRVESFSRGSWRAADYRPGVGGLTAGGNANRLRWRSADDETIETVNVYLPGGLVDATLEEYRRAGSAVRDDPPDALFFDDSIIARVCVALADAAATGGAELYAQSVAQFIVTHMLSLHSRLPLLAAERSIGSLPQRRLASVLDYMAAHYAKPLTLDELAREANVSRFHFVHLFRREVGVTPHQHLIALRLEVGARLLLSTDLSVQAIAEMCGYATGAHFAKAFAGRYGSTPNAYRRARGIVAEPNVDPAPLQRSEGIMLEDFASSPGASAQR